MPISPRPRQAGYVLVTVLILTLIASMVVFVSLRQNHLLERMGGNQQKIINANLAAGRGVADSLTLIQGKLASGTSVADIQAALTRELTGVYAITNVTYAAPRLSFISKGMYQDAVAYKKANFTLTSGVYPFNAGLVACNSLTQTGSGNIDSYNSLLGKYDSNINHASNASVKVLNAGTSTGLNINGGTHISGSVLVNGSAVISAGAWVSNQITTSNNLTMSGGTSVGSALVGGALSLTGGAKITGNASVAGGDASVSISGGASVGTLTKNATAPVIPSETCDPLNISSSVSWPASQGKSISGSHWYPRFDNYAFNPQSASIYKQNNSFSYGDPASVYTDQISPVSVSLFGSSKSAYVLDSLDIASSTLSVSCSGGSGGSNEVTIVVLGAFTMNDSSPSIHVANGCYLNVVVKGKTNLSQGTITVDGNGAGNSDGKSPFTIYSASSDDTAVNIKNGFSAGYASIYAPLTKVAIAAGSDMSGAVRAKDLALSGAGGMHYDEALAKTAVGGSSGSVKLYAIQDYYP